MCFSLVRILVDKILFLIFGLDCLDSISFDLPMIHMVNRILRVEWNYVHQGEGEGEYGMDRT